MKIKSIQLAWIVVKNFKKAVHFYTEVVGLKMLTLNEEAKWAEFEGHEEGGMRFGIAQQRLETQEPLQPGQNAVLTFTVDHIEEACNDLLKKGATLVGSIEEIPGHVKLQTVKDNDGNIFQLVQTSR